MPFVIVVYPVISLGIYAAGDAIGGMLTFADACPEFIGSGTITKVEIIDDDKEMAPIDLVLFDRAFTPTADNAPFDPTDADMENCIGYISVAATDYVAFNDNSVAAKMSGRHMPFDFDLVNGGKDLFGQMVMRSTPTYTAAGDITVKITVDAG